MSNSLINNAGLKKSIEQANIEQSDKDFMLAKLPNMDKESRISLFKMLTDIYLLDLEEAEAKERVRKFWKE